MAITANSGASAAAPTPATSDVVGALDERAPVGDRLCLDIDQADRAEAGDLVAVGGGAQHVGGDVRADADLHRQLFELQDDVADPLVGLGRQGDDDLVDFATPAGLDRSARVPSTGVASLPSRAAERSS